jgi:hypothetical protein
VLKSVAGIPPFHVARELIRRAQADCAVEIEVTPTRCRGELIGKMVPRDGHGRGRRQGLSITAIARRTGSDPEEGAQMHRTRARAAGPRATAGQQSKREPCLDYLPERSAASYRRQAHPPGYQG